MIITPNYVLTAYYYKKIVLPENNKHKYEFHYKIEGKEIWKKKLTEQKFQYTYINDTLIWIKNYYYGKQAKILVSYNGIFIFESDEADKIHSIGKTSVLLNKNLWELKAKKENDTEWLTRIDANFKNP